MSNSLNTLTIAQLKNALALKEQIARLEVQLTSLLGAPATPVASGKKKGVMSAAGRARIAAAQKKRWAKMKAEAKAPAASKASPAPAATPAKKKGGMSAAGRARIVAAQKARWAKVKAAKK
jgi:hypothetical protein